MAKTLPSPEKYFGYQLGTDRKIARWDKIVDYYELLDERSERIKVINLGPSTEGNPVLLVIVTSIDNMKKLERFKDVNAKLDDPRGLSDRQIDALIKEGKATVLQMGSMHPQEIGGTQMMPEFIYDLLTRTDEEAELIRENVISLFVPCANPDGNIMVCDWYYQQLGTEYEGCRLPWLDHKYCGHDNNRDAYAFNLVESRYWAEIMHRDWYPQVWQDHHQMGQYSPRFLCPPFPDPMQPYCDPLTWREHAWFGAHMAYKLEEAGITGVINGVQFVSRNTSAGHGTVVNPHNIAGFFTESASAKLATPVYIHSNQIKGGEGVIRNFAKSGQAQGNYPHLWSGGWWHLRDIVDQQKIAAWALLEMAARHWETVLRNHCLKASRQTERGAEGRPYAYVIPPEQHDALTTQKLIEKLLRHGIEIQKAKEEFMVNNVRYPQGSYVVFLGQPKMAMIKILLGRTLYPDDEFTRSPDGTPMLPGDVATDTLGEFMGIDVKPIDTKFEGDFESIRKTTKPTGKLVGTAKSGYILDGRLNDSFKACNRLLDKGIQVRRLNEEVTVNGEVLPPGAFFIPTTNSNDETALKKIAADTGIDFQALDRKPKARSHRIKQLRVGIYDRYWGGNMEAGWTEWVLEEFNFPYTILKDADIKKGNLSNRFDVIILPSDTTAFITGDEKELEKWFEERGSRMGISMTSYPPEYRSGFGEEGTKALASFVERGGTLLAFDESCSYAIEHLKLPVTNAVKDLSKKDYGCGGSTLNLIVDNHHPLGYGMPVRSQVLVRANNPIFDLKPSSFNERFQVIIRFPEERNPELPLLQSGWLIGEEKVLGKTAMLSYRQGKGEIILIGFSPHYKGWTHATFKLLFNCVLR
jgi:hypothetical protein